MPALIGTARGLLDAPAVSLTQALGGATGFYFDFSTGATGAGIASVSSVSPGTETAAQASASLRPSWTAGPPDYALFDGIDDFLVSTLLPATDFTMAACYRPLSAGGVAMGSNDGVGAGRCYLTVSSGAGFASCTWNATTASGSTSIIGQTVVQIARFRGSGSYIDVWLNGALVDSASTSGSPNTNGIGVGAIGNGGGAHNCRMHRSFAVQRFVPDNQMLGLTRLLRSGIF